MPKEGQIISQSTGKILTAQEKAVCLKISSLNEGITSRRAAVLLAIDEGLTRAGASEQCGLSVGQIQYLMTTFRKKRLEIFPDDLSDRLKPEPPADTTIKSKKDKAGKKEKKKKKSKKTKSEKKGKKKNSKDIKKNKSKKSKKTKNKKSKKKAKK